MKFEARPATDAERLNIDEETSGQLPDGVRAVYFGNEQVFLNLGPGEHVVTFTDFPGHKNGSHIIQVTGNSDGGFIKSL
jgi:hypothetical protein